MRRWTLWLLLCAISAEGWQTRPPPVQRRSRRSRTYFAASVAASDDDKKSPSAKKRLSRPERKALERAQKQRPKSVGNKSPSTTAPRLTPDHSTADDVLKAIKRAQNHKNAHELRQISQFLLHETDDAFGFGYKGSLLARLAVAALHLPDHAIAEAAIEKRRTDFRSGMRPMESAAIIRGLLRVHNVTSAWEILEDELSLPLEGTSWQEADNQEKLKHRALSMASVASRHFFEGEPRRAVEACQRLEQLGPTIRDAGLSAEYVNMPWDRILKGAAECQAGLRAGTVVPNMSVGVDIPCNVVYSVLEAMTRFPSDNNDRVYELLANALVRRVLFVTGAVSISGCPPADRGEVVFIGRSNVGKSSLVNMLTNRKSLAFVSKRPGKTQQFNFFAVNDKPGREKEVKYGDVVVGEKDDDSFYMVDVPGFGYAKVPEKLRREWSTFLDDYVTSRKTLRVVFHLVDGRHGPTSEDVSIMKRMVEILPSYAKYVIVLTKADKNVKGSSSQGKVSTDVLNDLRKSMADVQCKAPVLLTSAETKLGRDDLWRYMKEAAEARKTR